MDERNARDLEIIIDLFQKAGLQELLVRGPDLSLRLSINPESDGREAARRSASPTQPIAPPAIADEPDRIADLSAPASVIDPAWTAVSAPNLGTFYRSPKPGSPAFVEVGQQIAVGTEVCLIEVMKLFTSVRVGIAGTVRHIAAEDAQLVEGGQPLIYIEAD